MLRRLFAIRLRVAGRDRAGAKINQTAITLDEAAIGGLGIRVDRLCESGRACEEHCAGKRELGDTHVLAFRVEHRGVQV